MQRSSKVMQRETCCMVCDLRIGVIVLAITSMIESGQQIFVSIAIAVAYLPAYAEFPRSSTALLHVYTVFQIIMFVILFFGLQAVVSQGRKYKRSLILWILFSSVISVIQIIYLFYVIAYFNQRTMSLIAASLVLLFVPKNSLFAVVVYKYHKVLTHGFYTPDFDDYESSRETWRRSRAGSFRRDSVHTLKDEALLKQDSDVRNSRKVSTSIMLKAIPELSESKDSYSGESNADHIGDITMALPV